MLDHYQCIQCGSDHWVRDNTVICATCAARYPFVDGIGVFLEAPDAALQAYADDLAELARHYARTRDALIEARPRLAPVMAARAQRMIAGMTEDMALMESIGQPIAAQLANSAAPDAFTGWLSIQTGLSFHDMFSYFHQDWTPTPEFREAERLILDALVPHAADLESVAVLGAGACGIAHALAASFQHTFAVDLALPPLMLARRFLAGQPIAVHLDSAHWKRVALTPPPTPRPIEYVAANAVNLPFKSGSMSAIVTQCMLNVTGNPLQLAAEIRRVLKRDGVWVNFSHPFQVPGDPTQLGPRLLEELPELMTALGFQTCALSRARFAMLHVHDLDPDAVSAHETIHLFALRRAETAQVADRHARLRQRFKQQDPALWNATVSGIPGRPLSLAQRRVFGSSGLRSEYELGVGEHALELPESYAGLLDTLLSAVGGATSLQTIWDAIGRERTDLSQSDFLALMNTICVERYLLELRDPD